MIKMILLSLLLTPFLYLSLAALLVFLPVQREASSAGLDFSVLHTSPAPDTTPQRYYSARDGSQLFYREVPADHKLILVLLHGSGSEGRYLLPLARHLGAALGITVVLPDLRGHGRSTLSTPGDITYLGQLEDDLEDLNAHLSARHPDALLLLGGHSSGGGLALKYGGTQRLPFSAYLLLAPYLGHQAPTVRPNSGGWVQVSGRRYAGLSMLNKVGITRFNGTPVLFFNRPADRQDPLQLDSYSYRLNVSLSPQGFARELRNNRKPMLVLVGREDEAFYADAFGSVFAKNAPQAKVQLLDNVRHLNVADSPEARTAIAAWLSVLL